MPAATIVVVTWQSRADLTRLLASMNEHLSGNEELIVVDNASTDEPLEVVRDWKGSGWFVAMDRNAGYGIGANHGVSLASCEAVAIVNADVELIDAGLPRLASEAVSRGCLLGPRVLNPDRTEQPSASGPPTGAWPWVRAILPSPLGSAAVLRRTAPWRLHSEAEVSWLTGCAIAGPRGVLRQLGPFDPGIDLYGEDLDLGLRAERCGCPSVFCPELCSVVHHGKGSSSQRFDDLGRRVVAAHGRTILRRHRGARAESAAHRASVLGFTLRVGAKRALRRPSSWDRLELDSLRNPNYGPALPDGYEHAQAAAPVRIGG